jgi:hypothetical protein
VSESVRRCVYTALIGGYEKLNEQPFARQSEIPFICLTDDPSLRSETWRLRLVAPLFAMDPIRSQREFKLKPHVYLSEWDASLYIDNTVILSAPPEAVFERYCASPGLALARHSFRETLLDEFLEVSRLGFDDQGRIFEQLNHYTIDQPEILKEMPYWGGILLRDHADAAVCAFGDIWMAHVLRYSRRDQLSLNMALWQSKLAPGDLAIDNQGSWFHSWPHGEGRDRTKGARTAAVSFMPPVARIRQLEQILQETEARSEADLAEARRRHQSELERIQASVANGGCVD